MIRQYCPQDRVPPSAVRCGPAENAGDFAVVALRPQVRAIGSIDQLRSYTDAVTGLADAAFEDGFDVQRFGNLADILLLAAEGEGGGTRDDLQSRQMWG